MTRRVLWLSIGLLLGLALHATGGHPHPQAAVGAQGHEPSGQPGAVATDIPVDDLDRGTPRRTVEGVLRAVRAHDYQRATAYLDLRDPPAEEAKISGPQLARQLKIVLDETLPIDLARLSDSPVGNLDDGLPPDLEEVGRIETPGMPAHIRLQRLPREDGVEIWKISSTSVAAIPDLYTRYGYGLLGEVLPSVLNETEFLDTPLRQWVALPILIGMGYALGWLVTTLGLWLLRRRQRELASVLSAFVAGPVRLLVLVLFLVLARQYYHPSVTVYRLLTALVRLVLFLP